MCIKIMDLAYGYNKNQYIKVLMEKNNIEEVDSMLCDVIENARHEKDILIAKGKAEGKIECKIETARALLLEGVPIDIIIKCTNLSKLQIRDIDID